MATRSHGEPKGALSLDAFALHIWQSTLGFFISLPCEKNEKRLPKSKQPLSSRGLPGLELKKIEKVKHLSMKVYLKNPRRVPESLLQISQTSPLILNLRGAHCPLWAWLKIHENPFTGGRDDDGQSAIPLAQVHWKCCTSHLQDS